MIQPASRRDFLRNVSTAGTVGIVTSCISRASAGDAKTGLTAADFAPYVGQEFQLHAGGNWVRAQLAAVRPLRPTSPEYRRPFSLEFTTRCSVSSRMYQLEHPRLGTLELYMGPIAGPSHNLTHFEAIFG